MSYLEKMNQDSDSALTLLKSVEGQIRAGNFLAAISTLGSVNINLALAESNRTLYKLSSELENKGAING